MRSAILAIMISISHPKSLSATTIENEIACARRVAAMLVDPEDQAIVRQYISELAVEADTLSESISNGNTY